jgi:glycosyltransferase involved in cell wall biosynthesis
LQEHPLVSVLTICRNSEIYIERCIRSIIDQDYPNIEHIIQDGASTDGTVRVLSQYTDRVAWVSEKDAGQGDALMRALARSRGEVVAILDSDNEFFPWSLSWAVEQFRRFPDAAVVYGDIAIVDEHGAKLATGYGPDPFDFAKVFCCESVIHSQAAFFQRRHLELVGLPGEMTVVTGPDYDLWARLGPCFPFQHVSKIVALYRLHPGSETANPAMIGRSVQAKLQVIRRTCENPSTPPAVRALRSRAIAGLYTKAAIDVAGHSRRSQVEWFFRAFLAQPSAKRFWHTVVNVPVVGGLVHYSYMRVKHGGEV